MIIFTVCLACVVPLLFVAGWVIVERKERPVKRNQGFTSSRSR